MQSGKLINLAGFPACDFLCGFPTFEAQRDKLPSVCPREECYRSLPGRPSGAASFGCRLGGLTQAEDAKLKKNVG